MTNFIIITLLFLDLNTNNIFDNQDKIIDYDTPWFVKNVYCRIQWTNDTKLCGYSTNNNDNFKLSDQLLTYLSDKHYTFNSEVFEKWYFKNRWLYAELVNWNYLFVTNENELNQNNTIYSLTANDNVYIQELKRNIFYGIIALIILLWLWIILFPKKKN
jgi:hypothetical protein